MLTHLVGHIINNYDAMGSTIVAGGDSTKPLLACSVPLEGRRERKRSKREDILIYYNDNKHIMIENQLCL